MKKIVIVGAGALGSHLVMLLRNVEAEIVVVDFDRVEMKNTQSQMHGLAGRGKNKTQALQQTMNFLWKRSIVTRPVKLAKDNVDVLLNKADLVVDCTDNVEARELIASYCRGERYRTAGVSAGRTGYVDACILVPPTPCLHGALAANGEFGAVRWSEDFKADGAVEGAATCEDGEQLPFIGVAASYLALAVQVFLADGKRVGYMVGPSHVEKI